MKEFDYFKAWLIFFLVATVTTWVLTLILGSFVAAFLGAGGAPQSKMTSAVQYLGSLLGLPISYVTFRAVLGKFLLPKIWDDDSLPPDH